MNFAILLLYFSAYIGMITTAFYILSYHSDKKTKKQLFTDKELPTVSIIIPAWNEEKTIAKSIESALSSDYPSKKLEIIVINNNSKDKTLQIAKKLQQKHKQLKVYNETKQGKGCALNLGIKKSTGDFFFSMDAETFIAPHSVKEMIRYFKDPEVMCVSPSMLVYNPKGILQRVQQAEYLFGLFLRKAFTSVNAIYVTPGAFSVYRKTFTDKYGGYDEGNITEDLELALRIQSHGYKIENCPTAPAYTVAMNKLRDLSIQRRRWYVGLIRNMWNYRYMFSPKYGDLGLFVLPIAWISIFLAVFIFNYLIIDILISMYSEYIFLAKINFEFASLFSLTSYTLERTLINILSNPIIIFFAFFASVLFFYMKFATKKVGRASGLPFTVVLYFIFFAILFGFWWTVSIFYVALNKKVTWR